MAIAASTAEPTHRSETMLALVLAAIALGAILFVGSLVVLFDLEGLQTKVQEIFGADLTPPRLANTETRYAENTARNISERLIRDASTGLFRDLPGHAGEAPVTHAMVPSELKRLPPAEPITPRDNDVKQRRVFRSGSRQAAREMTGRQIPLLRVKALGESADRSAPPLVSENAGPVNGLARLGSPGEIHLDPEPPSMPDAPDAHALDARPPGVEAFPRTENAATIGSRLVRERPDRGYPSLDDDIEAVFTIYQAEGMEDAYFRLTLRLREDSRLPAIPKDVLYLIDISQSIGMDELRTVRAAVVRHLSRLAPGDRYNVVTFSEDTYFLHEDAMFVSAGRFDAEATEDFIDKHAGQRRTDVLRATELILARVPQSNRPSNVFLISDGKATERTSDVSRITHEFQRVNRDNFSIFTFDAGKGGNLYLLSLLSYRSRGQLAFEPEMDKVAGALESFADRFNQPVLTNVVANYTNIKTSEVYPEVLPNLYRDAPVTFWGRTTPGREVALRVAGLAEGGPREFFFRTVVPEGDNSNPAVLHGWARGKAHALMARLADEPENEALRNQVIDFAREHRLADILQMIEKKGLTDLLPWK